MTALSESFSLMITLDVFSLSIPTLLHFSRVGKPVLDKEAKNMPPHCKFDHKIHLENDQMPPHSHIYLLSGTELSLLCEFFNNMLGKGLIQPSQSPAGTPVLVSKKKDGTLRLCVDF